MAMASTVLTSAWKQEGQDGHLAFRGTILWHHLKEFLDRKLCLKTLKIKVTDTKQMGGSRPLGREKCVAVNWEEGDTTLVCLLPSRCCAY